MIRSLFCAALLATALTGCEDSAQDLMAEARMAAFEKRAQESLGLYRKALDIIERDDSPEALVLRARALRGAADVYHYELGDLRQAVAVYRELISQCPEAPETLEARVILADLMEMRFGDTRAAITELTAALARDPPQSAELHYRVSKLYFQLQDYPQAELEANKVVTKYETSAFVDDAMLLRAQALVMIDGRRADAQRAFEDLVHRLPESELAAHALFELGKLRDETGEDEKAIEYWVRALDSHPQPNVVQSQIARVRNRIQNTTPRGVGNRQISFDRPIVVRHVSSDAAMGVKPGSNEREPDVSHAIPVAGTQTAAVKPAAGIPAVGTAPAAQKPTTAVAPPVSALVGATKPADQASPKVDAAAPSGAARNPAVPATSPTEGAEAKPAVADSSAAQKPAAPANSAAAKPAAPAATPSATPSAGSPAP